MGYFRTQNIAAKNRILQEAAPNAPHHLAVFCDFLSRFCTAAAITNALSMAKTRSIQITFKIIQAASPGLNACQPTAFNTSQTASVRLNFYAPFVKERKTSDLKYYNLI